MAGVGVLQIASPNIIGDITYSLRSVPVSGNFFELLGARPALGRLIRSADDAPGLRHAVVLSYRAWREKFGGDSSVLGKSVGDPWDPARVPNAHAGCVLIALQQAHLPSTRLDLTTDVVLGPFRTLPWLRGRDGVCYRHDRRDTARG